MRHWLRRLLRVSAGRPTPRRPVVQLCVEALEERALLAASFLQTNMVSDIAGFANVTDTNLINPWGLTATGEFWVSDNGTGVSTLYNGIGTPASLVVTIPPIAGSPSGTLSQPSGIVNNIFATSNPTAFLAEGNPAAFIFDSQDGSISAWNFNLANTNSADLEVNNPGADYTGLAIGKDSKGDPLLYAANFSAGTIDVYDANYKSVEPAGFTGTTPNGISPIHIKGTFTDAQTAGFAPFNIQAINGLLYVEYAKFDAATGEGARGVGAGFVDIYNGDGVLQKRLIQHNILNAPWGVALAPTGFGPYGNDLLVGNFGNGEINVYNPNNGSWIATLTNTSGNAILNDHLWAIQPGTGTNGQLSNAIYFTAGIHNEADGLLGSLQRPIPKLTSQTPLLPNLPTGAKQTFSTVPTTGPDAGDQNPYGLAFVPAGFQGHGVLQPGDLLVANFNNATTDANPTGIQGTGSTIMRITPNGGTSVFFQGPTGLGLTTALGVLKDGFVLVGSVPTPDGTAANIQPGTLFILDANGNVVKKLTGNLLDSPWGLTINDQGSTAQVFVSNVVSGTVTRVNLILPMPGKAGGVPRVQSETVIGFGYNSQPNDAAVIVGPTGLAFDPASHTLYVASTADNAIYAIPNADTAMADDGTGRRIFKSSSLRGPLGMVLAPNGDLIVANGDAVNADPKGTQNSELIEFTLQGKFVSQFQVDTTAGSAFGLALTTDNGEIRFAAVDDNTNTVSVWTF